MSNKPAELTPSAQLPAWVLYVIGGGAFLVVGGSIFFGFLIGLLHAVQTGEWLSLVAATIMQILILGGVGVFGWFSFRQNSRRRLAKEKREQALLQAIPRILGPQFGQVTSSPVTQVLEDSVYLTGIFGVAPTPVLDPSEMIRRRSLHLLPSKKFSGTSYRAEVEDHLSFTYQEAVYHFAELHVAKITRTEEGRAQYTPYGTFLVLSSPVDHEFTGTTVVASEGLFWGYLPRLERVRLESPEFEKYFEVRSDSQREARVCLKTNVMMAWQDYVALRGNRGFMEFSGGRVTIGLAVDQELFRLDAQGRLSPAQIQHSRQVLFHLLRLTHTLNINHEYLYKH